MVFLKSTEKIQRRYPENGWDYKAISGRVSEDYKPKDVVYYTLNSRGKKSIGVEIFSGSNYIVGSDERSHSRRYRISNLPQKYKKVVNELIREHKKTKWSTAKRVDSN